MDTVLYGLLLLAACLHAQLPPYMRRCRRRDPNLDLCLRDAINDMWPRLAQGVPELDVPPLEPLDVPESLLEYRSGDVRGRALVRGTAAGLGSVTVSDVSTRLGPGHVRVTLSVTLPHLQLQGVYRAQGKLVVFPVDGKGVFNISMSNVTATWNLTGEHVVKQRRDHVTIQGFTISPHVGDMSVYASDLFTGNRAFHEAALEFANDYWAALTHELLPSANSAWQPFLCGLANRVFDRVPFRDIFP